MTNDGAFAQAVTHPSGGISSCTALPYSPAPMKPPSSS